MDDDVVLVKPDPEMEVEEELVDLYIDEAGAATW